MELMSNMRKYPGKLTCTLRNNALLPRCRKTKYIEKSDPIDQWCNQHSDFQDFLCFLSCWLEIGYGPLNDMLEAFALYSAVNREPRDFLSDGLIHYHFLLIAFSLINLFCCCPMRRSIRWLISNAFFRERK